MDEAEPGDAIYIEPGMYKGKVMVNKSGIKLIGLPGNPGESVIVQSADSSQSGLTLTGNDIEIINIQQTYSNSDYSPRKGQNQGRRSNGSLKITRKELPNKIAHYQFEVRVGNRPFDVVKIHRVVRELRPYRPVRTQGAVFMLHGAALKFEAVFLYPGTNDINPQTSSAFYLASKDIDVWGMDFAWTQVPFQTTDFGFMKDWGIQRDVGHTMSALSIARLVRGLTSQGVGRMNLLGYSYGVAVAYAAAGRETQQHIICRDIKGIVAVDQVMKYAAADDVSRQQVCNAAAEIKQQLDAGVYQSNSGVLFGQFGTLATTAPNDASPIIPGFTNYQAALFIGTSTFALRNPPAPFWHFAGGQFSGNVPTGLLYTNPERWMTLLKSLPPYQPQFAIYESRVCLCNEEDVSIDDHLGKITVPILYIGAGGAFGTLGDYTSSLTKSNDITNYTVNLTGNQRLTDFGHGDLFLGKDADDLVWNVLFQWLVKHNGGSYQDL